MRAPQALGLTLMIVILLASPLLWRLASGWHEDWNTEDITEKLLKFETGNLRTILGGSRACVFPAESLVVAHMTAALPSFSSNRLRSPSSESRLWFVVRINDLTKRWDLFTVQNWRVLLKLDSINGAIERDGFWCPCAPELHFDIGQNDGNHFLMVRGATEDFCQRR